MRIRSVSPSHDRSNTLPVVWNRSPIRQDPEIGKTLRPEDVDAQLSTKHMYKLPHPLSLQIKNLSSSMRPVRNRCSAGFQPALPLGRTFLSATHRPSGALPLLRIPLPGPSGSAVEPGTGGPVRPASASPFIPSPLPPVPR